MIKKFFLGVLILGIIASISLADCERLNLRLDYGPQNRFMLQDFNSKEFSLFNTGQLRNYFGDWLFFWSDDDGYEGGLLTRINSFLCKDGDVIPLQKIREVTLSETENRFGVGAELRIIGGLWITFGYYPTGIKVINSAENLDSVRFVNLQLMDKYFTPYGDYDYYEMRLSRTLTSQITTYQLYGKNFQIGLKQNFIGGRLLSLNVLYGVDRWYVYQKLTTKTRIHFLMPWSGIVTRSLEESTSEKTEMKSLTRLFLGAELEMAVMKNLKLALRGQMFSEEGEFKFQNNFLLESQKDFWQINIPKKSVNVSLIFSF